MSGHLFVLRGDLKRLACDAAILPCDDRLNITRVWSGLLPLGLPPGEADWLRLPESRREGDVVVLDDVDNRRVRAVVTTATDAVAQDDAPQDVARRLGAGVRAASTGLLAHDGRHLPLIAVPLVGTGSGGLQQRRAELIAALLPELRKATDGVDIALVLLDERDAAAVQNNRTDDADWVELPEPLRAPADTLGTLAGHDRLSLFIGAGVSKPVGLPDWWTLLEDLAREAGLSIDRDATPDPLHAATPIVEKLGDDFHAAMQRRLDSSKHGIGHALLAGLRVRQMVTTNFDPCMELAMDTTIDDYRVLTRNLADSSVPWLLKLHGDLGREGSLVLTADDYERHRIEYAALNGVVQSLMLTSHLLFVGFSLTDQNFLDMADAVARVRRDADLEPGDALASAGTALALTSNQAAEHQRLAGQLTLLSITDTDDTAYAARLLEIFLDRVAWTAARTHVLSAAYLLDDRYASGLNETDRALRDALRAFERQLPENARTSAGWPQITAALKSLGTD